jgi:hypothetical protein
MQIEYFRLVIAFMTSNALSLIVLFFMVISSGWLELVLLSQAIINESSHQFRHLQSGSLRQSAKCGDLNLGEE